MGAFSGLSNYLEHPLTDYAIQFGYDDANIVILEGDSNRPQTEHLMVYQNLLSCRHHSDRRTPIEYGQDLVASWVFEDFFLHSMQEEGINIRLSGADRKRTILPNQRTSTSSDYIIRNNNDEEYFAELVNDYTGYWYRYQKLHLRDNKYLQLQRRHSLLLALALTISTQKFAVFDFRQDIPAVYIPSHRPFGHKPAYELNISQEMLHDFSIENIKHQLQEEEII